MGKTLTQLMEQRGESLTSLMAQRVPSHPVLALVEMALWDAKEKHQPMHSLHEGYAVILEEVDELWEQVKKNERTRDPENIALELVQIAAMCCRMYIDLRLPLPTPSTPR
jgi:hypothetical protein